MFWANMWSLCATVGKWYAKLVKFVNWTISGAEAVDWCYAQHELLEKQGVDLRKEMQSRSVLSLCHMENFLRDYYELGLQRRFFILLAFLRLMIYYQFWSAYIQQKHLGSLCFICVKPKSANIIMVYEIFHSLLFEFEWLTNIFA